MKYLKTTIRINVIAVRFTQGIRMQYKWTLVPFEKLYPEIQAFFKTVQSYKNTIGTAWFVETKCIL